MLTGNWPTFQCATVKPHKAAGGNYGCDPRSKLNTIRMKREAADCPGYKLTLMRARECACCRKNANFNASRPPSWW